MKMALYILLPIACVLPTLVWGHPTGAGQGSCISLEPSHDGSVAQNSTPPYTLIVNTTSIKQGGAVKVSLEATGADGYFKGFMVQARCTKCTTADTAIVPGIFAKYNASDDTIKTKDCGNAMKNAITHANAEKKNSSMFTWTAPSDYDVSQGIRFRAVVVQSKLIWWNTIVSDEISVTAENSAPPNSGLGMVVVIVSVTVSLLL